MVARGRGLGRGGVPRRPRSESGPVRARAKPETAANNAVKRKRQKGMGQPVGNCPKQSVTRREALSWRGIARIAQANQIAQPLGCGRGRAKGWGACGIPNGPCPLARAWASARPSRKTDNPRYRNRGLLHIWQTSAPSAKVFNRDNHMPGRSSCDVSAMLLAPASFPSSASISGWVWGNVFRVNSFATATFRPSRVRSSS